MKVAWFHDKEVAKKVKGRTTPASGAVQGFVGDVVAGNYLIENKYSQNKVRLSHKYVEKFINSAKLKRMKPVFVVKVNETEKALVLKPGCGLCSGKPRSLVFSENDLKNAVCVSDGKRCYSVVSLSELKSLVAENG